MIDGSGFGGQSSITGILNPAQQAIAANNTALLFPKSSTGFASVRSKTRNSRVLILSDSTAFGVQSNGSASVGDMKPLDWPTQLSNYFNASGTNAHANSFFGTGNGSLTAPSNGSNDARIVVGSSWTATGGLTLGGANFQASTNTNAISFLPTSNVDTFNILYPRQTGAGFGKIQADINGGSATVIDENTGSGTFGNGITAVTGTLGANTVNIKWNSVANAFLIGIEAYDSSKKWVSICNAGQCGMATNALVNSVIPVATLAPDLTIIAIGINDWLGGVTIATYKANLQAAITNALLYGDVLLVTPIPSQVGISGAPTNAVQQTYAQAVLDLATLNNLAVVDIFGLFVSWVNANANGLMGDNLHPNQVGYAKISQTIFNVIGNI